MSEHGASLQTYNQELVKCNILNCNFLFKFYDKNYIIKYIYLTWGNCRFGRFEE